MKQRSEGTDEGQLRLCRDGVIGFEQHGAIVPHAEVPRRGEHAQRFGHQRGVGGQCERAGDPLGVQPEQVIKLSGIGCSSKTPAYFLSTAHGFNSVHGRMPSVATGALLANRHLIAVGVSGDGDTGAIGIGQFVHLMRRNLPMIYIVENNGCYGLTKGQLSPTADVGSTLKNEIGRAHV